MTKARNNPIKISSLLSHLNKNKRQIAEGVENNQFKFPDFQDLNEEIEDASEILNNISTKPYKPLNFDRSDALSSENINAILASMIQTTLECPIMEKISDSQRAVIGTAIYEACRVGLNLGFIADAMKLSDKRDADEEFKNSIKAYPKVYASTNGSKKNIKTRTVAKQFLHEILAENSKLSINKMASILEVDSKENTAKYGKVIPYSSCLNYARSVKNG